MEERQGREQRLPPILDRREPRPALTGVRRDVVVRQHRALGDAGGAARVDQDRDVVHGSHGRDRRGRAGGLQGLRPPKHGRVLGHRRPGLAVGPLLLLELQGGREQLLEQRHVVVQPRDDDVLDAELGEDGCEVGVHQVGDQDHVGLGVRQLMTHLADGVDRVVADGNGAEPHTGVEGDREGRRVRHDQGDPIALPHAEPGEHRAAPLDLLEQLRVGQVLAEPGDRRAVREPAGRGLQHREDALFGVRRQRTRHVRGVGVKPGSLLAHARHDMRHGRDPAGDERALGHAPHTGVVPVRHAAGLDLHQAAPQAVPDLAGGRPRVRGVLGRCSRPPWPAPRTTCSRPRSIPIPMAPCPPPGCGSRSSP